MQQVLKFTVNISFQCKLNETAKQQVVTKMVNIT